MSNSRWRDDARTGTEAAADALVTGALAPHLGPILSASVGKMASTVLDQGFEVLERTHDRRRAHTQFPVAYLVSGEWDDVGPCTVLCAPEVVKKGRHATVDDSRLGLVSELYFPRELDASEYAKRVWHSDSVIPIDPTTDLGTHARAVWRAAPGLSHRVPYELALDGWQVADFAPEGSPAAYGAFRPVLTRGGATWHAFASSGPQNRLTRAPELFESARALHDAMRVAGISSAQISSWRHQAPQAVSREIAWVSQAESPPQLVRQPLPSQIATTPPALADHTLYPRDPKDPVPHDLLPEWYVGRCQIGQAIYSVAWTIPAPGYVAFAQASDGTVQTWDRTSTALNDLVRRGAFAQVHPTGLPLEALKSTISSAQPVPSVRSSSRRL